MPRPHPHRRAAAGSQYALIVGLIGVVALLAVGNVGGTISGLFARVSNNVTNAGGNAGGGGSGGGSGGISFSFPATGGLDGGGTNATATPVATPAGGTANCPLCTDICRNVSCTPGTSLGGFQVGDQIGLKANGPELLAATRAITVTIGDATGSWTITTANPAAFDSADGVIFSNGGRTIKLDTSMAPGERHGTSVSGIKSTGKWYMEYTVDNAGTNSHQIGPGIWSNNLAGTSFGYAPYIRTGASSVNWYSTFGSYGTPAIPFGTGSVLPLAFDADARKIWLGVGCGSWVGGGNPASGTSPSITYSDARFVFPTTYLFLDATNSTANLTISGNFGSVPFTCTRPAGFLPLRQ